MGSKQSTVGIELLLRGLPLGWIQGYEQLFPGLGSLSGLEFGGQRRLAVGGRFQSLAGDESGIQVGRQGVAGFLSRLVALHGGFQVLLGHRLYTGTEITFVDGLEKVVQGADVRFFVWIQLFLQKRLLLVKALAGPFPLSRFEIGRDLRQDILGFGLLLPGRQFDAHCVHGVLAVAGYRPQFKFGG